MNTAQNTDLIIHRPETDPNRPNKKLFQINLSTIFWANPDFDFPNDICDLSAYDLQHEFHQFVINYLTKKWDESVSD